MAAAGSARIDIAWPSVVSGCQRPQRGGRRPAFIISRLIEFGMCRTIKYRPVSRETGTLARVRPRVPVGSPFMALRFREGGRRAPEPILI